MPNNVFTSVITIVNIFHKFWFAFVIIFGSLIDISIFIYIMLLIISLYVILKAIG